MVRDAVITVPAFFNQAERRAVLYAAELAGLRVLQLMNANTAGELGVFQVFLLQEMIDEFRPNLIHVCILQSQLINWILGSQCHRSKVTGAHDICKNSL